jgi:hypothetical protein
MSAPRGSARRRRVLRAAAAMAATAVWPGARAGATPAPTPTPTPTPAGGFDFALIGDFPYFAFETAVMRRVFASFDPAIRFVIHVGDIKGGKDRCDDALLASRAALLDESPVPLLYTPGDNEWTDCARASAGGHDPLERLQWLRQRFFARALPLGQHAAAFARDSGLTRQIDDPAGGLPENLQWRAPGARFVSVNLSGSNNALGSSAASRQEVASRNAHNARWLDDAFRRATRSRDPVVFVVAHANPRFDRHASSLSNPSRPDAYRDFRSTLLRLSAAFPGQTVLLHGDTHRHAVEPLAERLLRVECFGSPFSDRWVRLSVRPGENPVVTVRTVGSDPTQPLP